MGKQTFHLRLQRKIEHDAWSIASVRIARRKTDAKNKQLEEDFKFCQENDCFLVDVDFTREDFITKAIKCLTSFINKDYSVKPWNRQKQFDSLITPIK